ncbi:hypothetical protein ColLi_11534 [Colletotrichum liriopes]|uniref:Uncharacterized protein n=1 Tax=Colletotrichum liriopes TaxID=708192 RepID=A0AA37GWR8_9PEZI|nr:hypothetical protein ColLi_11534 [Colletotrichum liriopes]
MANTSESLSTIPERGSPPPSPPRQGNEDKNPAEKVDEKSKAKKIALEVAGAGSRFQTPDMTQLGGQTEHHGGRK